MPRTFIPEEQKRATDTNALANNIRPTPNRKVQVESDADGQPNIFYWDPSGEATNADGTTAIASTITEFADGGANEGLWRRLTLPVQAASAADLSDISSFDTTSGQVLAGNGSGNVTSQSISSVTSGNVALTDLSDVGTDANNRPQLPDLPSISTSTTPNADSDLSTKSYVDSVAQGLELKKAVVAATDGTNIDLASATDPNNLDGVTLSDGDRVLLKDQTTASENGIYVAQTATDPTTWTRATDFDEDADIVSGAFTFVEGGTANGNTSYIVTTNDPIVVGDAVQFSQFSAAGALSAGDGLTKSSSTFNINVSDFAGTGLDVVTGGDTNDDLQLALSVSDGGVSSNSSVRTVNFGTDLNVTDDGSGQVTIDSAATEVQDSGSTTVNDLSLLDFDSLLDVTNPNTGEAQVAVNNDLSQYSFDNVSTDDLSEGSNNLYYTDARVDGAITEGTNIATTFDSTAGTLTIDSFIGIQDSGSGTIDPGNVDTINFGGQLDVSDADATDGVVTIDASTAADTVNVSDGGTQVVSNAADINFASGITVTDDTDGSVTVDNDVEFGSATFTGDGSTTTFNIAHGLSSAPSSFVITATSDDASMPSHATADSTNITVTYDSAPPSGTDNVTLNYALQI